jgi:thiol-disulfide isomerase/thioredoxin
MKTIFILLLFAILLSIAGISLSGCMKCSSSKEDACPLNSETPPSIALDEIGPAELAQAVGRHRGRVVLVDYWATWCAPCLELLPHTVDLHNRFSADELAVITVSMDKLDRRDAVLDVLRRQRANTENYVGNIDSDSEAFEAFEIPDGSLPHLRIYDRAGKVFRTFDTGRVAEIEQAVIEAMEQGKGG